MCSQYNYKNTEQYWKEHPNSKDIGKTSGSDMTKDSGNLQSLVSEVEHILFLNTWHMAS